jgi:hypothetical protein
MDTDEEWKAKDFFKGYAHKVAAIVIPRYAEESPGFVDLEKIPRCTSG